MNFSPLTFASPVVIIHLILALAAFVVGGYVGSKLALRLPEAWVKLIFGAIMAYVAFKMLWSGYQGISNHES